jgi:ketosteroid isomerase-like protein
MPILAFHRTPSLTRERYEEVVRRLTGKERLESPADLPFSGLVFHAAGETNEGFCVFDVFESEEAVARFNESMKSIPREVGIEEPPEFFVAHTVMGLDELDRATRANVGASSGTGSATAAGDDLPLEEYHRACGEIVKGNPEVYKLLYSREDDATLSNPFGPPARGWSAVSNTLDRAAEKYRDGEALGFENVSTVIGHDLAYTVEIERYRARVGGGEQAVPVSLRVTTVFRRERGEWKVVHRHGDPITAPRVAESVIGS